MHDVEDLAPDEVSGRLVDGDHGVGAVADVHQWPPHPAAAVELEGAGEQRILDEGVDD